MTSHNSDFGIAEPLRVLHITDTHLLAKIGDTLRGIDTDRSLRNTLDHALALHPAPSLILATGDLAEQPCIASYRRFFDLLDGLDIRTICLPGNHDDYDLMRETFNQDNVNCDKQLVVGNWQFILLNSQIKGKEGGFLGKEELAFMESCLQNRPQLNSLIAVHHHCVPTGSLWMDEMQIENSDELLALIEQYPNTRGILMGHIHQPLEMRIKHLKIIATPSTCFQFKPKSDDFALDDGALPAYRWLLLHRDGRIETMLEYAGS
ncbi:MAG: 3',5'-cyclic-AMP phosphodiesterase [Gammaproteobacteria bacterium]